MNLAILHISDIHFETNRKFSINRIPAIANAVCAAGNEWDSLFLLLTGDIAFSGKKEQYQIGLEFVGSLKAQIMSRRPSATIAVFTIPGNHDCDYSAGEPTTRGILLDHMLCTCNCPLDLKPLSHVLPVQEAYHAFDASISSEPKANSIDEMLYQNVIVKIREFRIRIQLLNTAFACRRYPNKLDTDQGKLFFPTELLKKRESAEAEHYAITAMHHPLSWLESNNGMVVKDILTSTSDIVFFGHQHLDEAESHESVRKEKNLWIRAAALQGETGGDSGFNLVTVSLPEMSEQTVQYAWSSDIFLPVERRDWPRNPNGTGHRLEIPIAESMRTRLSDPGTGYTHPSGKSLRLEDLFVRPRLRPMLGGEGHESGDELEADSTSLTKSKLTIVVGDGRSGKTTLCKKLFEEIYDGQASLIPVLAEGADFKPSGLTVARVWQTVERAYRTQYGRNSFEKYGQLEPERRVIIIDNWSQTPLNDVGKYELLQILGGQFGKMILFGDETLKIEESKEYTSKFASAGEFRAFRIAPFGHLDRSKLIRKWIGLGQERSMSKKELHEQTCRTERIIDTVIGKSLVPSYPVFVLALLQMGQNLKTSNHANGSYGYLYESLITAALAEVSTQSSDVDVFYTILGRVGWALFEKGRPGMSAAELRQTLEKYSNEYKSTVEPMLVTTSLVRANILTFHDNEYSFKYKYIYYFFTARYISDGLKTPSQVEDLTARMLSLVDGVSKEENANIIIFLIYLTRNSLLLERLLSKAKSLFPDEKLFDGDEDVSFVNPAVKTFLSNESITVTSSPEANKDNERKRRDVGTRASEKGDDVEAEVESVSGPDSEFAQAIKLMDILGQSVRNFPGSMPGSEKVKITRGVYELGLRVMGFVIRGMGSSSESFREFLEKAVRGRPGSAKILTEDELEKRVDEVFVAFITVVAFGLTKVITSAVGLAQLKPTYDEVLQGLPRTPAVQLVDASVDLDHGTGFPKEKLLSLCDEYKNKWFARVMMRQLLGYHFSMFHVERRAALSVGSKAGVNMNDPSIVAKLAKSN